MGSLGCFGWLVQFVLWGLLYYGRHDLGPKWICTLLLLWLAGCGLFSLIPGGLYFFMAFVALMDIALVLVVFQGDVRLT